MEVFNSYKTALGKGLSSKIDSNTCVGCGWVGLFFVDNKTGLKYKL